MKKLLIIALCLAGCGEKKQIYRYRLEYGYKEAETIESTTQLRYDATCLYVDRGMFFDNYNIRCGFDKCTEIN